MYFETEHKDVWRPTPEQFELFQLMMKLNLSSQEIEDITNYAACARNEGFDLKVVLPAGQNERQLDELAGSVKRETRVVEMEVTEKQYVIPKGA